jgi:hypothetical protein
MTDYYESITSKIRARALLGMPILSEVFDSWLAEVERAAAEKALREAAFTGYFGTSAQSTLLRLAERREADRIESEARND